MSFELCDSPFLHDIIGRNEVFPLMCQGLWSLKPLLKIVEQSWKTISNFDQIFWNFQSPKGVSCDDPSGGEPRRLWQSFLCVIWARLEPLWTSFGTSFGRKQASKFSGVILKAVVQDFHPWPRRHRHQFSSLWAGKRQLLLARPASVTKFLSKTEYFQNTSPS